MSSNNDNKSNQKNPNPDTQGHNKTYQKGLDNRSRQLNPNHPEYKGSKSK